MAEESTLDPVPPTMLGQTRLSLIAQGVKAARPDIIVEDESLPVDTMLQLFIEDLGSQELLNISRHDLINGRMSGSSLISNAERIEQKFNSLNIVSIPGKLSEVFKNFAIELGRNVPDEGTDDNIYETPKPKKGRVYISKITGNIVIDVENLGRNDRVEVEILRSGDIIDDTIDLEES